MCGSGDNQIYWGIQLDQDLLETIISIYPEWFKDYNLNLATMADWNANNNNAGVGGGVSSTVIPLFQSRETISPPKAEVDERSICKSMDKNKESLKKKLLLRRPISQLIDQGIMPPLNTPPSFHQQRQKLERAKMGDILKNKIQRRPNRQELIQQHILEDTTVDPSLQEKQRQLKKARLADNLNDRISNRPGPLELIKGNILQADERLTQAVKEGQITFRKTCEGETSKHPPPRFVIEEDSSSDGALSPPQDVTDQSQSSFPSMARSETSPAPESPSSNKTTSVSSPGSLVASPLSLQAAASSASPQPNQMSTNLMTITSSQSSIQAQNKDSSNSGSSSSITNKNRKKSKSKSQPKTRTIKFHEYKGPSTAQKNHTMLSSSVETSYDLLLQQQQLFLQWQLEWQQKYPQIILPSAQKPNGDQTPSGNPAQTQLPASSSQSQLQHTSQQGFSKLEDMKVSDLKAELKKRNLPVSGSKPQLIERLKPYSDLKSNSGTISSTTAITSAASTLSSSAPANVGSILLDTLPPTLHHPTECDIQPVSPAATMDTTTTANGMQPPLSRPSSVVPMDIDMSVTVDSMEIGEAKEDIVKLQRKRIEELQLELQRSQFQLQQQQNFLQNQPSPQKPHTQLAVLSPHSSSQSISYSVPVFTTTAPLPSVPATETKLNQRQLLQQHLQQKIQQQQSQQQQQGISNVTNAVSPTSTSAAVKANLAAFLHSQHGASQGCTLTASVAQQPLVSFPPSVDQEKTFPTVTSILLCPSTSTTPVITVPTSTPAKPRANSLPGGVIHQKKVSLPTFSTMMTSKPASVNTSTDPQFLIKRPPPDYDEATKQLNKSKKNQSYPALMSHLNNCHSGRKSVKSQAVDDVLEILIKNGELPPSAAQEPPTPTTLESQAVTKAQPTTFPVITTTSAPIPPPLPTSTPQPIHQAVPSFVSPNSSSASCVPASLTMSPPSTVLNEADHSPSTALDFDLHLDLDDFEGMDLGVLVPSEEQKIDTTATYNQQSAQISQPSTGRHSINTPTPNVGAEFHDPGMDIELTDWLDAMMPPTSGMTVNNTQSSYSGPNDHDPLLSNMSAPHDPFDLLSVEDMDFKTPTLMWDFAT
ncbi:MKL/myocardin-like protein 1 isoform X1 [Limulus polyphemus]|uniref:MKL/myocardin-like protein 1 isoform X1 n=2 Tax=Limulus polyphemus TaxID=6850 RepID=A0ABM1T7R9_LIMPO|nr:MKL/myocardin-like protein 1 isoform X1 [Limulus polyphemus]